jgi:hypothetical protein
VGQILLVAIVVAATVVLTAGVASVAAGASFGSAFGAVTGGSLATLGATTTAAGTLVGGLGTAGAIGVAAAGGALGSIVGQGIGVATGLQDKFSWKGVALAGLSAGITQGIGGSGLFKGIGSPVLRAGANGAVSNAITQGVGVVTGLQGKFDWAGVAAAGVGAGVGRAVGGAGFMNNLNGFGQRMVSNMAVGIADAASRSVISGTDFGDNVMAALPDIIGQTIGGAVADGVAGMSAPDVPVQRAGTAGGGTIPDGSLPALLLASDLGVVQMFAQGYDSVKAFISSYVLPETAPDDAIVVTGTRVRRPHGIGWKIADAFGLHSSFFRSFWNGNSGVGSRVPVFVGRSTPRAVSSYIVRSPVPAFSDGVRCLSYSALPVASSIRAAPAGLLPEAYTYRIREARAVFGSGVANVQNGNYAAGALQMVGGVSQMGIWPLTGTLDIGRPLVQRGTTLPGPGDRATTDFLVGVGGLAVSEFSVLSRGATAANVTAATRANFNVYEVLAEAPITGNSRGAHRASANRSLFNTLEANPEWAAQMSAELGTDVRTHMSSGNGSALLNPPGAVWHHPSGNPDVMQLLRSGEHSNSLLQPILHPNGIGGYGSYYGN